jgi:putative ABC transport system permease protein
MLGVAAMLDRWREILEVLARRKLRTALTALSVAWGIFMLVILLAAGHGLSTGVRTQFARDAVNSVWINPGLTSKPYGGNPTGKKVRLQLDDVPVVERVVRGLDALDVRFSAGDKMITRGQRQRRSEVRGCLPGRADVHPMLFSRGRFIDEDDIRERRRVAVIERKLEQALFPAGEDPVGVWVNVAGSPAQVVGVFEEADDESEQGLVYLPLPTAQLVFGAGTKVDQITFMVTSSAAATEATVEELRRALGARKGFAPDDKRALFIGNRQEQFDRITGLFAGIHAFVWLIGLGTILAGVVGVSNIMLISVSERTREIGVRKAVGAPPAAIVRMIVEEAVLVTLISGYLGLVAAVAVTNVVARVLPRTEFFRNPDVDLTVGLAATAVLVVAGTLAGLFPALRAARINPIAALRVE